MLGWGFPSQTGGVFHPLAHDKAIWDRVILGEHSMEQAAIWIGAITRGELLVAWVDGQPGVGRKFLVGGGVVEVAVGAGGGSVRRGGRCCPCLLGCWVLRGPLCLALGGGGGVEDQIGT